MTDRPRLTEPAQMSAGIGAFSWRTSAVAGPRAPADPGATVFPQLVVPARLIVPATATVKRSLWVFRARKPSLLKD
ncbi:MAG: hypothetical protein ACXWJ8_02635 [Xanthobacteraceae bacterium]